MKIERLLLQQETLRQVIEEISSELELRPLLTHIVRLACELLGADDGTIGLYDRRKNVIRTEAEFRMPAAEMGAEMGPGEGLAGQVLLERKTVVHERYGSVPNPTLPELEGHAVVGVPILWRDSLIGFFGIGAKPPRRFDSGDVEILSVFARHAAIAIENARRYHHEKERAERLGLLARVGRTIAASLQRDDLLQNAADAIHQLLGYQNVAIPLLDGDDPAFLRLRAVGGRLRRSQVKGQRLSSHEGLIGAAVRSRKTQRTNDFDGGGPFTLGPEGGKIYGQLAIPILHGQQVLGVLYISSTEPMEEQDVTSLEITADQLAVAIQNAALFEQAQKLAVLEERQRLARELHDSVTQMLFSATLIGESVAQAYQRNPKEGERRVTRLLELNRSALGEMRGLLKELRPADSQPMGSSDNFTLPTVFRVRRDGIVPVLTEHLQDLEKDGLEVLWEHEHYQRQEPNREEALFRIAQEALHNMIKHAKATRVQVKLSCSATATRLSVTDDGAGFDAKGTLNRDSAGHSSTVGMGLDSMRERARSSGGTFRLESRPGYGTSVQVVLPPVASLATPFEKTSTPKERVP